MTKESKKILKFSFIAFLSVFLVFSFVLHDLVPHDHSILLFDSTSGDVFTHSSDRKALYLLIALFLFAASLIKLKIGRNTLIIKTRRLFEYLFKPRPLIFCDKIRFALSKGVINSKVSCSTLS